MVRERHWPVTRNSSWIEWALNTAENNKWSGHLPRMGAVLVKDNLIVSFGYNRMKTHPLQAKFGRRPGSVYLHAEIDAIVYALRLGFTAQDLKRADLFVARVLKNGQPALAKPCLGCQRAIMHFGIRNVEWTTSCSKN